MRKGLEADCFSGYCSQVRRSLGTVSHSLLTTALGEMWSQPVLQTRKGKLRDRTSNPLQPEQGSGLLGSKVLWVGGPGLPRGSQGKGRALLWPAGSSPAP